jgi:hypothetical protein
MRSWFCIFKIQQVIPGAKLLIPEDTQLTITLSSEPGPWILTVCVELAMKGPILSYFWHLYIQTKTNEHETLV